jgi:hypothetical protein
MSRLIAVLLVFALARPDALLAQAAETPATLAPGARIRLTSAGEKPRTAVVVSHTRDTLLVRWPEIAGPVAVPLAGISRLEVSTGRHRRVRKGMALGTVAGSVTGALVGAATYEPCTSTEFLGCFLEPQSRAQAAAWGALAGGTLGFVVGSLAGLPRREGWKRVSLQEQRVAVVVAPRAHQTRLGASIRF